MPQPDRMKIVVEGANIIWANFSGKEGMYNREGDRHFSITLDEKTARQMEKDGWNVKWPRERDTKSDEEDTRSPTLQIAVKYKVRPPRVVLVTSRGRVQLNEDTVGMLDWADISNVDLIAVASTWEVNGKTGIKAYLKTMYVTIEEDELEKKYGIEEDFAHSVIGEQ